MIAALERRNLPVSLYKNTHLRIPILKNTQSGMRFEKEETEFENAMTKTMTPARHRQGMA